MKLKVYYKDFGLLRKLPIFKLALIMKLTGIMLLATCLQVSAAAYSQKITLSEKNVSLENVFKKIMKQSDYMFLYNNELLQKTRNVSINVKNAPLENVLQECFNGQPVSFTIYEKTVVVRPKLPVFNTPPVPPVTIRGKVLDENNIPLPGASVLLKNSKLSVITNGEGQFSMTVPEENVTDGALIINFLGYQTREIKIAANQEMVISLQPSPESLSEVVVIGYGTQKKANVTGAVSSFNAENLDERPILRADQALVGQLAGVTVKQTNGVPGKGFNIQVRGTGSISAGNEPLYVLDGFPLATAIPNSTGSFSSGNPLDNINPNDIESIQVLKDAAAAAIYGSRAANGVVLITTKKGKMGASKINFNTNVGYVEANRKLDMLSAEEFIDRATEIINGQWVASVNNGSRTASQTNEQRRIALGLPVGGFNTAFMTDDRWYLPGHPGLQFINWQDETFRKGLTQNYQLSASGANNNVNYYISGNYVKQEGMVRKLDYTAYSGRANVELNAKKFLKFGLNIAPTYSISNDPGVEGKDNILHQLVSLSPVQQDLSENVNVGSYDKYAWSGSSNSPVAKLNSWIGLTKRFRTLSTLFGELTIANGLTLRTTLNLDNTDNTTKTYVPFTIQGTTAAARSTLTAGTSGTLTGYKKTTFVNENTLNYNLTFKNNHNFNFLAGTAYNTDRFESNRLASSGGFSSSVITTLSAASGLTGTSNESKNVLVSYFGRAQYDYKGKYLLSASIRRDGSSRFGENNSYGWFPSASAGWRVSEEEFMKSVSAISDLKLRFSYGEAGNNNIGDYNDPVLGAYPYVFNSAQVIGQLPSNLANPDLTWETSITKDFGMDYGVLKNRITGSFDYYIKDNINLLINSPVLAATGFNTLLSNTGHVRNKGFEVELTSRNFIRRFQWNTALNFSHNSNKVVSLVAGQNQILIPSALDINHSILRVGQPMYSIFVVKQIGVLSPQDITNNVARFGNQSAGDPKYEDFDASGVIDANDRQIVGHPTPDYTWGITNSFRFKNFDLSFLVQGQNGGSIYSLFGRSVNRTGTGFSDNVLGEYRNRWRSPDNPSDGKIGKALQTFGRIKNTDWLYPSDYVRVRNITLGYDLGKIIKVNTVQGARIYLTAENFFGHDNYTGGFNPEATNTDLSNSTSFPEAGDYGGLPLPKSLVFGLNFTF